MDMQFIDRPQQRATWRHWSVLTMIGLSVTYSWLWVLTYRPMHSPEAESEAGIETGAYSLDIVLETQQPDNTPPPALEKSPPPRAATSTRAPAAAAKPVESTTQVTMTAEPLLAAPEVQTPVSAQEIPAPPHKSASIVAAVFKPAEADETPQKTTSVEDTATQSAPADSPPVQPVSTETAAADDTVKPSPTEPQETASLNPVPVSRLTRTPAFVDKVVPTDPKDVQIPPGGVRVTARITLDATAAVRDVQIDKSGEPPFDVAVISAIHRSRFTPGYIGDQPVATVFNQTYRFQLQ